MYVGYRNACLLVVLGYDYAIFLPFSHGHPSSWVIHFQTPLAYFSFFKYPHSRVFPHVLSWVPTLYY